MGDGDPDDGGAGRGRTARRAAGRQSISWRILYGSFLAVILALLLAGSYFLSAQRALIDESFRMHGQVHADWIGAFAVEHLVARDYPALEHAISKVAAGDDDILSVEVIHDGNPVASFRRATGGNGVEFRSDIRWRGNAEVLLGQVRTVHATGLRDRLLEQALVGALLTILAICATLFISLRFMLRRTVLDPLAGLLRRTEREIVRALPASELPDEPARPADEIQLFERRFNALLEGLDRRNRERDLVERQLTEHRDELERLVEERTRSLRLAQEEAQRLNRAKSEFLAAASHDLRQPLQAIRLFHSALSATPLDDKQRRMMDYLSLSLTSLNDLLNALLDISRLDAGLVMATEETVPVERLFEKIDAEFSSLARQKGLRFNYFFPRGLSAVRTDGKLLLSLLGNLIGNALKYTERGGVLMSVRRRGDRALIQVWDTGLGIAEEYRERIFDEYFQIGNQERDRAKGVGLGLSIVRRLSRILGTEVSCRSLEGRGSVFGFSLPLAVEAGGPAGAAPGSGAADAFGDFRGSRVVVIEDDVQVATAIRLACEAMGMTAIVHRDAESALGDDAVLRADYFVSDFRLPGMSGVELFDRLRGRIGRPVNAVLLTGEMSEDRLRMLCRQEIAALFKPVNVADLLQAWRSQRG